MMRLVTALIIMVLTVPILPVGAANPPVQVCQDGHCYERDPLGGWGLNPKRTYSLAYDGDKVCKPIVSALNKAVNGNHKKAIASVTFFDPTADARSTPFYTPTYRSQNPLFSDPMFLRWKPPSPAIRGDLSAFVTNSDYGVSWQIVDLENNGHRYFVTSDGNVWNVPEGQLWEYEWQHPLEWKSSYKILSMPWPGAPPDANGTNPLNRWRTLEWSIPGKLRTDSDKWLRLSPKFPVRENSNSLPPWESFDRNITRPQFAEIGGRTYTVLYDPFYDLMIVDDLSRKLGDDLCYIQSDINDKIRL